jgi:AFG3 family protein
LPKRPDVELPGGERGKEEHEEEDGERSKLGGKAGKKVATGGGGGGGGGGSGGPGGMPGGFGGLTPNQLLLAVVSTYALYSLSQPGDQRTREITWQEL